MSDFDSPWKEALDSYLYNRSVCSLAVLGRPGELAAGPFRLRPVGLSGELPVPDRQAARLRPARGCAGVAPQPIRRGGAGPPEDTGDARGPGRPAGVEGAGVIAAAASALAEGSVAQLVTDLEGFRFAALKSAWDVNFLPGAVKYGDVEGILSLCGATTTVLGRSGPAGAEAVAAALAGQK